MAKVQYAQEQAPDPQQQAPAEESQSAHSATKPEKLSLPELIRIMDVATELRKEQEVVEEQLNIDQIKARLRERLLEAAKVSGEPITAEQIDAAIDEYYDKLHSFEEPKWGFRVMLAHLYVRRGKILKWAAGIAAAAFLYWSLLASGMLPGEARTRMELDRVNAAIEQKAAAVRVLSADEMVETDLGKLLASAETYGAEQDIESLDEVLGKVTALQQELAAEYDVVIVDSPDEKSGIDRYYTDDAGERVSGYYLIVEARGADGQPRTAQVLNRETGKLEARSRWAEQVPKEVYDRVAADKQADGVLDARIFAEKVQGERVPQVMMRDSAGVPIVRQGQITSW